MLHQHFEAHFYFIRHGESLANYHTEQLGSDMNSPLSERGKKQAHAVGLHFQQKNISWTRIYSSTFPRAFETAKIACQAQNIPIEEIRQSKALVEQSQGSWNGLERKKIYTPNILAKIGTKNSGFVPPEGESLKMVERRVSSWLEDEILYNKVFIEEFPKAWIAVFSHGMAIRCLIRYIFQSDPSLTWKIKIFNGSISSMVFKKDGWHPYSLNETAHLTGIGMLPH